MPPPIPATAAATTVATSTTSAVILPANPSRLDATIWNDSSVVMYITFGGTATSATSAWALTASSRTTLGQLLAPGVMYTGAVSAVLASSTGNARCTELS